MEEVEKDKPEILKSLKEEEVACEGCCELSLQREKVLEVSDSDDG